MNKVTVEALKSLIAKYGISLCNDPKDPGRCKALLLDECGTKGLDATLEINVLVLAIQEGVPSALISSAGVPSKLLENRLTEKLCNKYGLSKEVAVWAVESWLYVLDLEPGIQKVAPVSDLSSFDDFVKEMELELELMGSEKDIEILDAKNDDVFEDVEFPIKQSSTSSEVSEESGGYKYTYTHSKESDAPHSPTKANNSLIYRTAFLVKPAIIVLLLLFIYYINTSSQPWAIPSFENILTAVQGSTAIPDELPADQTSSNLSHDTDIDLVGTYTGTYTASQGISGVRLEIYKTETANTEARFIFYPVPQNPNLPSGEYLVVIEYTPDNKILFTGYKWIDRPSNYHFVDFRGSFDDGILAGIVLGGQDASSNIGSMLGRFSIKRSEIVEISNRTDLVGTYTGTYTASQGLTGVTLEIFKTDTDVIEAKFIFYPVRENPDGLSGEYLMKVDYRLDGTILFSGYEWIIRPSNYAFVDFTGFYCNGFLTGDVIRGQDSPKAIGSKAGIFNLEKSEDIDIDN